MNHFELLKKTLEEKNVSYQIFNHEKFSNTEEALSFVPEVNDKNAVKSLFFKYGDLFVLVLLRVCNKLDKEALKKILETESKIQFASPDETLMFTHCEVGTVSPFVGLLHGVRTLADSNILSEEYLFSTPGTFTSTLKMNTQDFFNIAKPEMVHISLS